MRNPDKFDHLPKKEKVLKKMRILFPGKEMEVREYPGQTVVIGEYPYALEYKDKDLKEETPDEEFTNELHEKIDKLVVCHRNVYRRGLTSIPGCIEIRTSDAEKIYLIPKDQSTSLTPSGVELNNETLERKLTNHLKKNPRSTEDVAAAHVLSGEIANVALTLAGVKPVSWLILPSELESNTPFCTKQIYYNGLELKDFLQHDIPGIKIIDLEKLGKGHVFLMHRQALQETFEKNGHIFRRAGLPCKKQDNSHSFTEEEIDIFFDALIENYWAIMNKTPEVFGLLFGFDGRSVFQYRKNDDTREEWNRQLQAPSIYGPQYRIWDPDNNPEFQTFLTKAKHLQAHIEEALDHATPFEVMQQLPSFYIQSKTSQDVRTVR